MTSRINRYVKKTLWVGFLVLGIALYYLLIRQPTGSPRVANIWVYQHDHQPRVLMTTWQEFRVSTGPRQTTRTHYETEYEAYVVDPLDGTRTGHLDLDDDGIVVYGVADGLLWLFQDTLEGRDPSSLASMVDARDLKTVSARLPIDDAERFYLSTGGGGLVVRLDDDHPVSLRFPELSLQPTTDKPAESDPVRTRKVETTWQINLDGYHYALISDDEIAAIDDRFAPVNTSDRERRRLRKLPTPAVSDRGTLDWSASAIINDGPLLMGAFLKLRLDETQNPSNPRLLICGKTRLGLNEPWYLAAYSVTGELLWKTEIEAYGDSLEHVEGVAIVKNLLVIHNLGVRAVDLDTGRSVVLFDR